MEYYLDNYENLIEDGLYTKAINYLISIKDCTKIIFSKNKTYMTGTIYLKSNLELYFEDNSKLIASNNIDDFNKNNAKFEGLSINTFVNCDYDGAPKLYFLYGKDISNFKISGNGIIDGNEEIFYGEVKDTYIEGKFYPRMPLIFLENCRNIEFTKITLTHSAFWTVHLVGCDTVLIDSIKILNNRRMLNADGIDPDHSKNITIKDSYIESADDCIVIKGTKGFQKYGDSYNINVSNCILKSTSAAIKFGTETYSKFYNIHFSNIKILDTNRAISMQMRDTGDISNITFDNIEIETHMVDPNAFWGKAEAIAITAVKRNDDTVLGHISNISFNNIKARCEHGIFVYGNNVSNVSFENINIHMVNETKYPKNIYDLRPGMGQYECQCSVLHTVKAKKLKFKKICYKIINNIDVINSDLDIDSNEFIDIGN